MACYVKAIYSKKSSGSLDSSQQLLRSDIHLYPWGSLDTVCWSKTIQFREQVVQLPLPAIPGSPPALLWLLSAHGTSWLWHPQTPKPLHFLNSPDLQLKGFLFG